MLKNSETKGSRTLLLYPALAPYRIDLFNRLGRELDFKVVFLRDEVFYHRDLNQNALMNSLKCEYEVLQGGVSIGNRNFNWNIWREIVRFQPDVTITVEYSLATMLTLLYKKSFGRRHMGFAVMTVDNPRLFAARKGFRKIASHLGNRNADSIIVYTDEIRQTLGKSGIPIEKIFVCANHQEEDSFAIKLQKTRELAEETARRYELGGKRILLFVGRLVPAKGLDRVIQAFAKSAPNLSESILVLVGDGPERQSLESLAEAKGVANQVLFLGYQEKAKLLIWYLLAKAFVLCSDLEPYGAVVNEALLAGIPILCSSHAGAHVLIEEGKNGYVFDPYDIESLSRLITKTLSKSSTDEIMDTIQRPNLMPIPFERDVREFVAAVKYAVAGW